MTSDQPIRWGIIGPGTIAAPCGRRRPFAHRQTGGDRHSQSGKAGPCQNFPGARIVDGYEALLSDKEIDAIYIAVPPTQPCRMGDQGGTCRQRILVEKPIALSAL
ncbi:Gfo/Idh/MocA family oxidoreductase [Rhizobium beringeri]